MRMISWAPSARAGSSECHTLRSPRTIVESALPGHQRESVFLAKRAQLLFIMVSFTLNASVWLRLRTRPLFCAMRARSAALQVCDLRTKYSCLFLSCARCSICLDYVGSRSHEDREEVRACHHREVLLAPDSRFPLEQAPLR